MSISTVECVQNKYSFNICHEFNGMVTDLNLVKCPKKILGKLERIFEAVKLKILAQSDIKNIKSIKDTSHSKILYCEKETSHGIFKIEGMLFTGDRKTCLHTHPEFVIDEVISGKLIEDDFVFNEDKSLSFFSSDTRGEGSLKKTYDLNGNPHKVTALDTPCITLCLSLGKNGVVSYEEK